PYKSSEDKFTSDWLVSEWAIEDLNGLLARACERMSEYLLNSPDSTDKDREICALSASKD
ncbi:MAG: hypothetical protein AAFY17_13395, partial [Cyanobacteria bacterium J06642_11]